MSALSAIDEARADLAAQQKRLQYETRWIIAITFVGMIAAIAIGIGIAYLLWGPK